MRQVVLGLCALIVGYAGAPAFQQQPTFRARTDLVQLDVDPSPLGSSAVGDYYLGGLARLLESLRRSNVATYSIDTGDSVPAVLRKVADETGGFVIRAEDFDAGLDRLISGLDHYYLLGFYPEEFKERGYHQVTVHVGRPGLTVRHRRVWAVDLDRKKVTRAVTRDARIVLDARNEVLGPTEIVKYQVQSGLLLPAGRYQLRASATSGKTKAGGSVYLEIEVPDFKSGVALGGLVIGFGSDALVPVAATAVHEQRLPLGQPARLDANLPLFGLGAGAYVLRVAARDGVTTAQREVGFSVR